MQRAVRTLDVTVPLGPRRPVYPGDPPVAVAPLLIARGVQNKVLEAMAMARPVIASAAAFEGIRAQAGRDLLVADGAAATAGAIAEVLRGRHPGLGEAGRRAVMRGHDWSVTLGRLDPLLECMM
jgi:glycosyltransferase involved in cell wall biosynthesis